MKIRKLRKSIARLNGRIKDYEHSAATSKALAFTKPGKMKP